MKAFIESIIPDTAGLSPRECEVIRLMATGLTRKEAAKELCLSSHTVNDHIKNAMVKTGALNIANLVKICFEQGVLMQ